MVRGVPDHRIRSYIKKHMDKIFQEFPIHKETLRDINESLENLCRTLSGKNNVKVKYDVCAYTDGEKITLCNVDVSYEDILGLAAHESGHIAYDSFSNKLADLADTLPYLYGDLITDTYEAYKVLQKKSGQTTITKDVYIKTVVVWAKQIVNLVEDIRINKINEKEYMGFGYFVRKYEERCFEKFFESEMYGHPIMALLETSYYISGNTNSLNDYLLPYRKLFNKIRRLFDKHQHLNVSILVVSKLFPKLIKFFIPPSCRTSKQCTALGNSTPTTKDDMITPHPKVAKRNKKEEGMSYGDLIDNLNADIDTIADSKLFKDEQKKLQAQIQEIKEKLYGKEFDDDDEFTVKVVRPDQLNYSSGTNIKSTQSILNEYKTLIAILKKKFIIYTENQDKFRRGRLANNFVKSYVDNYPFIFTQKRLPKRSKISFLIDVSGSMSPAQLEMCKIGVLVFTYALNDLLNIRIALFAGGGDKAYNVIIKDFDEEIDIKMLDKIGRYRELGSTPTGISARQEYKDGAEYLIVFTDGYPAFKNYGIDKAIDDFKELRKRMKGIFGYIIDCDATDGLRRMFNNNYVQLSRQSSKSKRIALILQFAEKVAFKLV